MSARVVFTTLVSLQRPSEYCIGMQKERVPSKAVKVAPIPSAPPRCSPLPRHCSQPAAATPLSFSRRSTTRAPWSSLRASAAAARTLHAAPLLQEAAALRGISGCSSHRAECGRLSGGVPVEGLDGLPNNGSGDALGEGWLQDVRVLRRQQHGDGSTRARARLLSSESSASLTLAARPRVARRGPLSLGEGTLIRAQ